MRKRWQTAVVKAGFRDAFRTTSVAPPSATWSAVASHGLWP